jgi:hypothetical protein
MLLRLHIVICSVKRLPKILQGSNVGVKVVVTTD